MTAPKTIKEFLILAAIAGGIILPGIGFVLLCTDRGNPTVFGSIAIGVALGLGILFWFGLGLVGILRVIGTGLIVAGVPGLAFRPLAAVICLLIGVAFRVAALRMTGNLHQSDAPKA